ncbi:alpha-amylase family glycosyl hydrolase [Sandaracinus amylolyticus]|uniref:alpha-amylase family glycosyl hydrolase n=1 Tax=Sandaracinus amylolyticus TaxID=927083 RepID=UPI001EEEC80E|nr:alpha-amylase family glycosyl hydrolase [Sandaracinus amylolyticus]UJR79892.1 Maltodextrin glucosidase [Sandaracinus amylolyticus]
MNAAHKIFLTATALTASLCASSCVQGELDGVRDVVVRTNTTEWRDQIIYQLLTDRFANGDASTDYRLEPGALARYQGGDWEGIVDRLDYLEELGVTALWISPIVLNVDYDAGFDAYHGYWAVDLERLNPHFGDLASLRGFVNAAHERGMLVILDIVTNHMGQVFYYDINGNGQPDESVAGSGAGSPVTRISEYDPDYDPRGIQGWTSLGESGPATIRFFDMPEIFRVRPNPPVLADPSMYNRRGRVTHWDCPAGDGACQSRVREMTLFGDFPGGLKDLDTTRQEVRDVMVDSYVRWVLMTDIDGFRIDTLKHVEYEFWDDFAPRVRERLAAAGKESFFMFGEAFDGDDALIGSYTRPGRLDSVFYFSQKFQVFGDVFQRGGPTDRIRALYEQRGVNYGTEPQPGGVGVAPRDVLVNFMDNHDVPRFLYDRPDEQGPAALRAALAYLLTEDGIPCIYYGTEQEYAGGNDPQNREPLWWSGYRTDGETFQWIARLTRIRRGYRALTHGDFELVYTTNATGDASDAGVVAFERETGDGDYALVVINAQGGHASSMSDATRRTALDAQVGTVLVDLLEPETTFTVGADGAIDVGVGPYQARILVPQDQQHE